MELRDSDKEIGILDSFGHHHVPNREPSQALDHNHLYHQPKPSQEFQYPRRDPDPLSSAAATGQNLRVPASVPQSTSCTGQPSVQYRECLKNHAANVGGHVVDGCGEFMPGSEVGTLEALKCAACECHRSFHRKESNAGHQPYYNSYNRINGRRESMPVVQPSQQPPPRQHHQNHHRYSHMAPKMVAFGGGRGAPADSSSEDLNMFHCNLEAQTYMHPHKSKKRFRTKFSQEQKDKMMEFAEKLEWKLQKQHEQELQKICTEVGVKRQVFKVWLHNSKQAMKKKTHM